MKSILDPAFRYTPSVATDIRKTFDKERARLAAEKRDAEANKPAATAGIRGRKIPPRLNQP